MTYEDIMTVARILQFLKNEGRIPECIYASGIQQVTEISEIMCTENDIVLIGGEQFKTISRDTPLGEKSLWALQSLCHWLQEQHPAFKPYFVAA
jgi:hypothetical protein